MTLFHFTSRTLELPPNSRPRSPKDNTHVSKALIAYRSHSEAPWIAAFTDRYLAFNKLGRQID